jgi:Na+/H+ antiporter NhaD/arsenite permease-like protein
LVFRIIPYLLGLVITVIVLLLADRKALRDVDYFLLLTFAAFFVFSGNMGRIEVVRDFFDSMLQRNTLLVSILSCQFISNVPTAILLSQFTENYKALLIGVNIGGTGTLIASLASLITFKEYTKHYREKSLLYIGLFTLFNFAFLAVLTVVSMLIL